MASDPEARTFHDAESSSGEHCADENDRIDEGFEDIRQDEALLALEQEYLVLSSILPLHRAKALASSPDALCGSATHGGEAFRAGGGTDAMYGEMGFWAMASILRAVELHGGLPATPGDFVDLGSGSGLAVAAAGLLRPHAWGRLRGVENSAPLHAASLGVAEAYAARRPRPAAPDLELEEGDAAQVSLEGATLVLAHCTAFSDALLHAIALQAAAMRPGAWVVTLTRPSATDGQLGCGHGVLAPTPAPGCGAADVHSSGRGHHGRGGCGRCGPELSVPGMVQLPQLWPHRQ